MQTLENLAKILGPSILPNMQSARAGAECDAALIINAVHDMMRGYKQGTLFSTCIPEVTERMQHICPQEAQQLYKVGGGRGRVAGVGCCGCGCNIICVVVVIVIGVHGLKRWSQLLACLSMLLRLAVLQAYTPPTTSPSPLASLHPKTHIHSSQHNT